MGLRGLGSQPLSRKGENMLQFKDHVNQTERSKWLKKELKDAAHTYRIPGYNVPSPYSQVSFKRRPTHCVDVGVNVGGFSIYASPFFKNVTGFEPARNTYHTAVENIKSSGKKNIKVNNLAVGDKSGETVHLRTHENELSRDASCFNPAQHPGWGREQVEEVSTICLEDIYSQHNIDYIDYMKVDCEGSEYPLLINKDLSKINFLSLEIHPGLLGDDLTTELLEYLKLYFKLHYQLGEHILFYETRS